MLRLKDIILSSKFLAGEEEEENEKELIANRTISRHLKDRGWDMEHRLYLGFGPRRLQVSVVVQDGGEYVHVPPPSTIPTQQVSKLGHEKIL